MSGGDTYFQGFCSQNIPTLKDLENPVAVSDSMSTPDTTTDSHDHLKRSLLPQAFVHPLLGGLWVLLDTTVERRHRYLVASNGRRCCGGLP